MAEADLVKLKVTEEVNLLKYISQYKYLLNVNV